MKADALKLRRKIAVALTCLPLTFAACDKSAPQANNATSVQGEGPRDEGVSADAGAAQAGAPDTSEASETADAGESLLAEPVPPMAPPEEWDMPSCPTTDEEFTREAAVTMARMDPAWKANEQYALDCPTGFNGAIGPMGPQLNYLDVADTQLKRDAGDADTCVYEWVEPCPGGRILVDGAEHCVAELRDGDGWSGQTEDAALAAAISELPERLRAEIARAWLEDARIEHASVASFARATLELMLHGAPPHLLAVATRAAGEEVAHARDAFALAALYSGRALEAGPLEVPDVRRGTLAELAVETFIEGCVGETIATLATTRALDTCAFPAVRRVLQTVVDEESEHAALAWSTVVWAVQTGGEPVRHALLETAERLRAESMALEPKPSGLSASDAALLARHGRLNGPQQHEAMRDAWRLIIDPLLESALA